MSKLGKLTFDTWDQWDAWLDSAGTPDQTQWGTCGKCDAETTVSRDADETRWLCMLCRLKKKYPRESE